MCGSIKGYFGRVMKYVYVIDNNSIKDNGGGGKWKYIAATFPNSI